VEGVTDPKELRKRALEGLAHDTVARLGSTLRELPY
jgi:hypothetical protein